MLAWFWNCRFDTGLDVDGQIALAKTLDHRMKEELKDLHFDNSYCESHEAERDDFVSTFGGLFFLGILLSINSQMLTVFLIPIAFACVHLAVVLPLIHKLLMLFGLFDIPLLCITAVVCACICGIFYGVVYKMTSKAYYQIVSA